MCMQNSLGSPIHVKFYQPVATSNSRTIGCVTHLTLTSYSSIKKHISTSSKLVNPALKCGCPACQNMQNKGFFIRKHENRIGPDFEKSISLTVGLGKDQAQPAIALCPLIYDI